MFGVPCSGAFGAAAAGVILSVLLLCPQPSQAGQWRVTPGITVNEAFSDNATLANESQDRNADLVTVAAPNVSVRGSGGRINLNFDYSLQQRYSLKGQSEDSLRNALLGGGQVELWKDALFLNTQASISRQTINGARPSSGSIAASDVNSATVRTVNVNPVFRHHFGNWVDTETNVNFSVNDSSSQASQDTRLLSERLRLDSGQRFTVFLWSVQVQNLKSMSSDNSPAEKRRNIDGDISYVFSSNLLVRAGAGWEKIESGDFNDQPTGLTWNVGLDARPSSRTTFNLTVGERGNDFTINGSAQHQFSTLATVNVNVTQSIQTTEQLLSNQLTFLTVDPVTGVLIDSRTGQPFVPGDATFGLDNNSFRQRRYSIGLNGVRRRTSYGTSLFYEEREFDTAARTEVGYGGSLQLGRQHTPRLSSAISFSYRHFDPDDGTDQVENEGSVASSVSYQVSNTARAALSYQFSLRRVNKSPDDFHENSVTVTLSKTF